MTPAPCGNLFRTLKSERLVFTNPTDRVRVGKPNQTTPHRLTPETLKLIGRAAAQDPALLVVLALVGVPRARVWTGPSAHPGATRPAQRPPRYRRRHQGNGPVHRGRDRPVPALAGATALVSARATGVFTDGHQRFWDTARRKAGDRDCAKALIGVLLLHRTLPTEAVLAGIDAAVRRRPVRSQPGRRRGARRHLDSGRPAAVVPDVPSAAGVDDRPVPTLDRYDEPAAGPGHDRAQRPGGRRHQPWRKFRYTLANFVSRDMPPRAALPEPIRGTNTPG
jgi:hypothetical protein